MPKIKHSASEKILKDTVYLQPGEHKGKTIKGILKGDWDKKRIVQFKDGTRVQTNKDVIRASIDVKLDREYRPKALDTLKVSKDGTAKVKIGGMKEGEVVKYSSKANAERAVNNYYGENFDDYKQGKYPKRCNK